MLTTDQLRNAWGPPCSGPSIKVSLFGAGVVTVRPEIADAVAALNACLQAANYPTRLADTGAFNCRKITGGTGYSLHAYKIALDLNWSTNPYGAVLKTDMPAAMTTAIQAVRTKNGKQVWRWGGTYSGNKDAMHFEVVCTPADLATGIAPGTTQGDDMTPDESALLAQVARDVKSVRAETDKFYTGETITAIAEAVVKILPAEHGGGGISAADVAAELSKRLAN